MEGKMARRASGSSDIGVDSEEDAAARNNRDASPDIDEQSDDDDEDHTHDGEVLAGSAPMSTDIYTTNARDGLNLRSGPGTDFPIIRSLPFGTQVHLIRREGRWGLIDEQG